MTAQDSVTPAFPDNCDGGLQGVDQRAQQIAFEASVSDSLQVRQRSSRPTLIWSANLTINQHETLRVQLQRHKHHAGRYHRSLDGELKGDRTRLRDHSAPPPTDQADHRCLLDQAQSAGLLIADGTNDE
jgi:hypothetical protein